jgi:hypothetical protein
MSDAGLLNVVLYLPLAAIAAIIALPRKSDGMVRGLSLAAMLLQFVVTRHPVCQVRRNDARPAVRDATAVDRRMGRLLPDRAWTATTCC